MARTWIPAERVLAVLDGCGIRKEDMSKNDIRRVFNLRNGRQEAMSLEAVDRLLTNLDLNHMFQVPAAQGGLWELYTGVEVFTPVWAVKAREQLASVPRPRKYATPEEAAEANRERGRRRRRSMGKRCACGAPILDKSKSCRACHLKLIAPPHGTVSRYTSLVHRCRCDLCRAASAEYHRDRQRAMRAAYKEFLAQRRAA